MPDNPRPGTGQHGHLCLRNGAPDRPPAARRHRSGIESRFRQGHHPGAGARAARPRPSLLRELRPLGGRRQSHTGATSARSTPSGRPISTSPISFPRSISMTSNGRSGPMPRSPRRPSSSTTRTAAAAWQPVRWFPAAASFPAPRIDKSLLFTGVRTHSYGDAHPCGRPALCHDRPACPAEPGGHRPRGHIPEGLVVGEDPEEDAHRFRRTPSGVCLITQPMIDRLRN